MQGGGEGRKDCLPHLYQIQESDLPFTGQTATSRLRVVVLQALPEHPLVGGERCCHRSLRTP